MQLHEVPIGAEFTFTPESEEVLQGQVDREIARYIKSYGPSTGRDYASVFTANGQFVMDTVIQNGEMPTVYTNDGAIRKQTPPGIDIRPLTVELIAPLSTRHRQLTHELPARNIFSTSCDPEIFLENEGELLPAFSVLPLQKEAPNRQGMVSNSIPNTYAKFYQDGFGAEMSPAPNQCHVYVSYHLSDLLKGILQHVRKTYPKAKLSAQNFVRIPEAMMAKATDPQVSLGCQPSQNVYGTAPYVIDNPRNLPYRMVGGHIHLGSAAIKDFLHSRVEPIITAMDAFCGVPAVALFEGIDDPRRREYYGRAGEFRLQPHGLEYRTLSNAWLSHPILMHLVFNLARGAFRFGFMNWQEIAKIDTMRVQHIINNYDADEARRFVQDYKPIIEYLYTKDTGKDNQDPVQAMFRLMERGVAQSLPRWQNIEENWAAHQLPGTEERGGGGRCLFQTGYKLLDLGNSSFHRDAGGRFAKAA